MKFRLAYALSLGFGAIFVFALLTALEWPLETRIFTLAIAVPGLLLALLDIVAETKRTPHLTDSRPVNVETHPPPAQPDIATGASRLRATTIFAWIFALVLLIKLMNFKIAIPLFTFLYLKFQAHEGFIMSLLLTGFMILLTIGLFDFVLHVPWPKGLIEDWFQF